MIKLIATDVDETLVNAEKNVPLRNIEAIKKAQDMGIIVMVATGRGTYELYDIPDQAGVIKDDRYAICCNGAVIMDVKSKEIIDVKDLKYDYAKKVLDFAYVGGHTCYIYTLEEKYALNPDKDSYAEEDMKILEDNDISFLKDRKILKAIIKNKDMNYLQSLEVDIAYLTNYDVEIAYSSNMFMEINAKGINKALALKKVCDHYGIDIKDTMTIGDNYNDIAMLEAAGFSVAVKNARLQVKEVASYVAESTNEEGAVGEAIEKFIINK